MTRSANGVTVPAIRKKIIVWSRRRIQRRDARALPVDAVIEGADAEQGREAGGVDRDGEPGLGALGEQDQRRRPSTSETKNAYSCETPRSRGFTLAICSAAAALARRRPARPRRRARRATRSTAASRASASPRGVGERSSRLAGLVQAFARRSSPRSSRTCRDRGARRLATSTLHLVRSPERRKPLATSRIAAMECPRCRAVPPGSSRAARRRRRRRAPPPRSARSAGSGSPPSSGREAAALGPQARRPAPALRPHQAAGRAAARRPQAAGRPRPTSRRWSSGSSWRSRRRRRARRGARSASSASPACSDSTAAPTCSSSAPCRRARGTPEFARHRPGRFRPGRARECSVTGSTGLRARKVLEKRS